MDRNNLGPFVRGYLNAMLKPWPSHSIEDISERFIQQCIRDCVHFYYRNHLRLEDLWFDLAIDYTEQKTGRDFWYSRNMQGKKRGFEARLDPFNDESDMTWMALEASAIGFGELIDGVFENPQGEIDIDYESLDPINQRACDKLRETHATLKT